MRTCNASFGRSDLGVAGLPCSLIYDTLRRYLVGEVEENVVFPFLLLQLDHVVGQLAVGVHSTNSTKLST